MKKIKKIGLIIIFIILLSLPWNKVFAEKTEEIEEDPSKYSREYQEWLKLSDEEKEKWGAIPRKYDVPFDVLYEKNDSIIQTLRSNIKLFATGTTEEEKLPEKFDLRDVIDIPVRDQKSYGLCWAFASMKSLETNLALHGYGNFDFSELHLDYLESEEFGKGYKLHDGRNFSNFINYVSNNGPVLEEEVPYDAEYTIDDYDYLLNLERKVYVTEIMEFPTINKKYNTYTSEELKLFRDKVKEHVMKNGGIYAFIASPNTSGIWVDGENLDSDYYNRRNNAEFYTGQKIETTHAVTIIGWDDNYPRENFNDNEELRPKENGAYIMMNSWGKRNAEIIYVSYEDYLVESDLNGIISATTNIEEATEIIEFEDENLYNEIKEIIDKKVIDFNDNNLTIKIVKGSLNNITSLNLANKKISKLKGLESFKNISYLDLSNNSIESVDELFNLKSRWMSINISNNNIKDVSKLENFIDLNLSGNPIEKGLDKLTKASTLNLDNCGLNNELISSIPNTVNTLILSNNNIADVSFLEGYSNLYTLNISNNIIQEGLDKLPDSISELYLDNCNLDNNVLERINNLKYLGCLSLVNNNITDLTELSNFSYCRSIDLSKNTEIDLSTISFANFPLSEYEYRYLGLDECNITDINNLNIDNISSLSLKNNSISDLTHLKDKKLSCIYLENNNITEVSGLNNINTINLSGNINLTNLDKLENVEYLTINNINITNFDFINSLNNLKYIELKNNNINSFPKISNDKLYNLNLSNNNLSQMPDISDLNNLDTLDLSYNSIEDVSNIEDIIKNKDGYFNVNISNNKIKEIPTIEKEKFYITLENQKISQEIDLEINKDNRISLPGIIKEEINNRYRNNTKFKLDNCKIDYKKGEIIIHPTSLGKGVASIKVESEKYNSSNGTTFTIDYDAKEEVGEKYLEYKNSANKSVYIVGDDFDNSDLVVRVVYENGLKEEIDDYNIINGDDLQEGPSNIIIEYKNLQKEIPIQVFSKENVKVENVNSRSIFAFYNENDIVYSDIENKVYVIKKSSIEKITTFNRWDFDLTGISQYLYNLNSLELNQYTLSDENIDEICKLDKLEELKISNCQIRNRGYLIFDSENINKLSEITTLQDFYLEGYWKFEGFESYREFPNYFKPEDKDNINVKCTYTNNNGEEITELLPVKVGEDNILYYELDKEVNENKIAGYRKIEIDFNINNKITGKFSGGYEVYENDFKLEITHTPYKQSYLSGQNFDPTGMKVKVVYNNGTEKEITDYIMGNGENLKNDIHEIYISYSEGNISRTTTQPIDVYVLRDERIERIVFEDDNLYNAMKTIDPYQDNEPDVRRKIVAGYDDSKNTVYLVKEKIDDITWLDLDNIKISNISGISRFTNLEYIDLAHNESLTDITELESLNNLKQITLGACSVNNIENLLILEKLERINISQKNEFLINKNTTEVELPPYMYQAIIESRKDNPENVKLEANKYYATYDEFYDDYYLDWEGVKEELEVIIDEEQEKAKVKIKDKNEPEHEEGLKGIEIKVQGGKIGYAKYEGYYNNLTKIEVTEAPKCTSYKVGSSFNPAGMKLMATYRDNSEEEITDYDIIGGEQLQKDQEVITISYTENGITKTTEQRISVEEKTEEEIEILKDDSEYRQNENYIYKINPETKYKDFKEQIKTDITCEIEGKEEQENIKTGDKLIVTGDNEEKEYTLIVAGDVNKDGLTEIRDIFAINSYRRKKGELEEACIKAGDVNGDGQTDIKDIFKINSYRRGKTNSI